MEVGVFSGERLNINCEPLVDELIEYHGYIDLKHLMSSAIWQYIGFDRKLSAVTKQVTLNNALGRKKVRLPENLLAAATLWAKNKSVDFSYVCTMAVKDLHVTEAKGENIPY